MCLRLTRLSECDHRVVRREDEVGQETAIHRLHPADLREKGVRLGQRVMIRLVFPKVIREVRALMLNVKAGLADGVEPNHQFSQARRARHEDDLVVRKAIHFRTLCGNYIFVADGEWGLQIFYYATSVHLEVIGMDGGVFRMRVTGPIGGQAQLQYSSDLATWDNLGVAVTFGVTPIAVSDPDASQHPQRFYPAVLQ